MADRNSILITRQWEAPTTVTASLNIIDRLISLNKAASQDDVQPQAAIAIENLGVLCLVSPDLIGEGVDALKGNESVRVKDTKLLIGLSNGGYSFPSPQLHVMCARLLADHPRWKSAGTTRKRLGNSFFV